MKRISAILTSLLILIFVLSSCAKWTINTRRDLDEVDTAFDDSEFPEPRDKRDPVVQKEHARAPETARRLPAATPTQAKEEDSSLQTLVSTGTVSVFEPQTKRTYKNGQRATREDFIDIF